MLGHEAEDTVQVDYTRGVCGDCLTGGFGLEWKS